MFYKISCMQGFSLDSGHSITRSRSLTVVAGAPRANHSGAVVLLKKENDASGKLLVERTLYGPGLASSFGYDVAVVDLNGDGWETFYLPFSCFTYFKFFFQQHSHKWIKKVNTNIIETSIKL